MITTESPKPDCWSANEWRTLVCDGRYFSLWSATHSKSIVVRAGFIEQPPLKPAQESLPPLPGGVILLLTGCFAPVHAGHLDAMGVAKKVIENVTRLPVAAGFLGFCHDNYVRQKPLAENYGLATRLRIFHTLNTEPWIHPLTWEAQQESQTNFTSVVSFLETTYPQNTVAFIYGSDNADFKNAIGPDSWQVCVHRSGSTIKTDDGWPKLLHTSSNHPEVSSTLIRSVAFA